MKSTKNNKVEIINLKDYDIVFEKPPGFDDITWVNFQKQWEIKKRHDKIRKILEKLKGSV